MGMHEGTRGTSARCSARTRRSSRSCTSATSPIRRACDAEWRAYFDELRGDAADVAHAPVVESFRRARAQPQGRAARWSTRPRCTSRCSCCASSASTARSGMLAADLDPLKQHAAAVHRRTSTSRPTASPKPTWTPSSTSARSRRARSGCGCATSSPRCSETYARTLGAEYMYITDTATKRFVQERLEPIRSRPSYDAGAAQAHILERLTAAETLERYLHTKYVGQKRFSGEGGDTMIPMLDQLIQQRRRARRERDRDRHGASRPAQRAGQHRWARCRPTCSPSSKARHAQDLPAGDVKYHQGFSSDVIDARRADASDARVQPVAPRDRQSGRRGLACARASTVAATRAATRCCRC